MDTSPLRIAYITAGAGGMYCGSCMNDNTLARELGRCGVDVQLIPTYTPIRTDSENVSIDQVFYGGINVVLQQRIPLFRRVPLLLDRVLDSPRLLQWATRRQVKPADQTLGELTLSMLRGEDGFQRKEARRLCQWLANSVKPQLVNFSNILIAGCAPTLKRQLKVPVVVTLQGDDIFLQQLTEKYRQSAIEKIRGLAQQIDAFLVHSQYYADFMSDYLGIQQGRIHKVQLGVSVEEFSASGHDNELNHPTSAGTSRPPTIGYLARLAPEKGLHVLCKAFALLRQNEDMSDVRLRIAGWLGPQYRDYARSAFAELDRAGLQNDYCYVGELERRAKIEFLYGLDVLSVPTTYREPKGLYVLEALAAGVPVVQPRHGAFPELLESTGGGRLVRPDDPLELAETLRQLVSNPADRRALGQRGQLSVRQRYNARAMALSHIEAYERLIR